MVLNFYWNQSYIAEVLCENKEKPQLKCGGKCQLMKQMKAEEEKEKQLPNLKLDGKEILLSSKSFFATIIRPLSSSILQHSSHYEGALKEYHPSIFHPPGAPC